jgi:hypothetical protein
MQMKMPQWNKRWVALPALGLLAMLPHSIAAAQTTYTLTVISSGKSVAGGINANGDVTGQDFFSGVAEAFLVKGGKETKLTVPPNPSAAATPTSHPTPAVRQPAPIVRHQPTEADPYPLNACDDAMKRLVPNPLCSNGA